MQPSLHYERLSADERTSSWLYVAHGIYGAGRNWGTVARRLIRARPDWGVLLIDLRLHGASRGFDPPHTIAACADDIVRLAAGGTHPPDALLGHSFGGKVALAVAGRLDAVRQVWVIDSTPSRRARGGAAAAMLDLIRELPARFDSREELIEALTGRSFDPFVARWMATNLERADSGFVWRFDLDGIAALLDDFFEQDLWSAVEIGRVDLDIRFVRATRSEVLTEADASRIGAGRDGSAPTAQLHDVEGGHWLNADNPEALVDLLADGLPST